VLHLPALPGDASHEGATFSAIEARVLADAEAYVEGGVSALVVENFGSAPFHKGTRDDPAPPHQLAALAILARKLVERFEVPIGVNCLRNDVLAALGAAAIAEASFVRVNVHVGAYVTDQGLIEGAAPASLAYRRQLDPSLAICADVLVKHAAPLVPIAPEQATREALDRGLADAVIATGSGTGRAIDRDRLTRMSEAAAGRPILLGSGLTPENARELTPLVTGAIVGTYAKRGGDLSAPVEPDRVRALAAACAFAQ
jgi:membrane complex biogenesis BtpA family protein